MRIVVVVQLRIYYTVITATLKLFHKNGDELR
jgi:hypothetical protein